ncbi:hypothetical protein ACFWFF_20570, partial [Streptomyces sp. NPDC060223]
SAAFAHRPHHLGTWKLFGTAARATTEALPALGGAGTARATVSVRGRRVDVPLGLTLPHPAPPVDTVPDIQRHVVERTRESTRPEVPAARVGVTSLALEPDAVLPALRAVTEEAGAAAAPYTLHTRLRLSAAPHRLSRVR